jgi:hypothetical protein
MRIVSFQLKLRAEYKALLGVNSSPPNQPAFTMKVIVISQPASFYYEGHCVSKLRLPNKAICYSPHSNQPQDPEDSGHSWMSVLIGILGS